MESLLLFGTRTRIPEALPGSTCLEVATLESAFLRSVDQGLVEGVTVKLRRVLAHAVHRARGLWTTALPSGSSEGRARRPSASVGPAAILVVARHEGHFRRARQSTGRVRPGAAFRTLPSPWTTDGAPVPKAATDPLELLWSAAGLERILAERDYPALVTLAAFNRILDEGGLEGSQEAVAAMEELLERRAGASARLARCSGQPGAVDGVLCAVEELVPLAPSSLGREIAEEGARLLALHHRPGEPPVARDLLSAAIPRLDSIQRFAEETLGHSWRLVNALEATQDEPTEAVVDDPVGALVREAGSPLAHAGDWAAHRSFVYLASRSATLAGAHGDVSDRLRVVGNAAVELRRGAAGFPATLSAAGSQVAMLALGGSVLSAATGITAFFGMSPAALGPEAAEDLRALREGLDAVRLELDSRFDEVDARLGHLLVEVDARFGRLEAMVAAGRRATQLELQGVHREVLALGHRMERMEENLHSYMQAGFDREYARTLIRCLEHRERHLPPHDWMEFAVFSACLTDFRARAVQDARDALLADRTTSVDDGALAEVLADRSLQNLSRRLPLLARVAWERFDYGAMPSGTELANAVEWAVASQAYLTMLQDWPEHARAVAPGDLEAMRITGARIRDALAAMVETPGTGARGELLQRVRARHEAELDELYGQVDALARRHRQEELMRTPPERLLQRIEPEEEGLPALEVPPAMAAVVPQEAKTAAMLGLGDARFAYRLTESESVQRGNLRRRFLFFGRLHDRLTFTRIQIAVELHFEGQGLVASWRADSPPMHRLTEEMAGGFDSDRVRSTRVHVADPVREFLAEQWPELASEPLAWDRFGPRASVVRDLDAAIEADLQRRTSTSVQNVVHSVCRAEDPEALALDDADRESASRILASLGSITGTAALLRAYATLGLPAAAAEDPALQRALFGHEGILDRQALCWAVAAGESPLRLIWLDDEPRLRTRELETVLDSAAAAWDPEVGLLPLVAGTLQQVEAALRIQRVRGLVAGS